MTGSRGPGGRVGRASWTAEQPGYGQGAGHAAAGGAPGGGYARDHGAPDRSLAALGVDAHAGGPAGSAPDGAPSLGGLVGGAVLGVLLGAASSTMTTALAVGVAGTNADRLFQPVEFTVRVALLLVAPCMGAVLAALFATIVVPRHIAAAPWAIGLGVLVGPVLALHLERLPALGRATVVAFGALLVCWAVVGGLLAAAAAARRVPRAAGGAQRPPYGRP